MSDGIDNSPSDQNAFEQALADARQGDREAVGRMLEMCRDYLLLIANQDMEQDLNRKMGASDLVQESMLNAQAHFDRFDGSTKPEFLAWLRGILKHDALHWRRHYKGVKKRQSEQSGITDSVARQIEPKDAFLTPGTQAAAQEEEQLLLAVLEELPEKYRHVISMRNFDDKSFVEIGEQFGCSADAARKLWTRAIVQVQEFMEQRTSRKDPM